MSAYEYDRAFIDYTAQSSTYSARVVTSLLAGALDVESVLDVGCAAGTWLRAWQEQGVADVKGIDGSYVDPRQLIIPQSAFLSADLAQPFRLERTFGLVQSLEVAEHVPREAADIFAENLALHASRFILFSAAPPGQGGEFHVNEQPYDYWRERFGRHGFAVLDCIRPAIFHDKRVSFWYRYNLFLYARREALRSVADSFRTREVLDGECLRDISPAAFRLRKAVVRRLPPAVQNAIARIKARIWRRRAAESI